MAGAVAGTVRVPLGQPMIAAIALAAFSVPRRVGHVGELDITPPLGASDTSVLLLVMWANVLSVLGVVRCA